MGQKINPNLFRLGINKSHQSVWYSEGNEYIQNLHEDLMIKKYIKNRLKGAMISKVTIARKTNSINIDIHTARPGQVIGRKGESIDTLRTEIAHLINKKREGQIAVFININEIKKVWLDARLVGEEVARQLQERVSFRRAMKFAIRNALKDGALGIKVQCSGRLGGAEMARTERYQQGRTPLQTLRADIDFAIVESLTTYGIIGIKVWIYKGDILSKEM
ncbi:MAG TPA: 30S ribosomal protein S3 [Candidatus Cloacimonadota bacterium]|nr:30S ribosomal protein S3 [Candidatus Cloacimonadota bacterium]HPM01315.1 30S ribosomal protein S3 [Candidatus Cloacimonadota bacterium]